MSYVFLYKNIMLILRLFFIFVHFSLFAQVDPADLKQDWWAQDRNSISDSINQVPSTPQTQTLVQQIKDNLQSLKAFEAKSLPPLSPPPTYALSYTLDEYLEIHRDLRKKTLDLNNEKQEQKDKSNFIDAAQARYEKKFQEYQKLGERTEEKLLAGLEIIQLRSSVELAKKDLEYVDQKIARDKEEVERLKDEQAFAADHLRSEPSFVAGLENEISKAAQTWGNTQNELRLKEAEAVNNVDATENKAQFSSQSLTAARINDTTAYLNWVNLNLKLLENQLILEQPVDLDETNDKVRKWSLDIEKIQKNADLWTDQVQRQIQRTSQGLSTEGNKESDIDYQTLKTAQNNLLALQKLNFNLNDSSFLIKNIDDKLVNLSGNINRWIFETKEYVTNLASSIWDRFNLPLFNIGATPITLWNILRFLGILLLTFWTSNYLLSKLSDYALTKHRMDRALVYRLNRLFYYLALLLGFLFALTSIGFDFSSLLLVAGALGVGLGFGLQSIFNNFISGIIMLFESHIKVGDYIEVATGMRGEVKEINFRTTILGTNDGIDVIVPNSEIISNRIINWTLKHPFRRVHVPFSVAYGTDKDLVEKIIVEAAKKVPQTLEKPGFGEPFVILTKFSDNALEFELIVWVNEKYTRRSGSTISDYLWVIDSALTTNNIHVPFPQRDLNINSILGTNDLKDFFNQTHS